MFSIGSCHAVLLGKERGGIHSRVMTTHSFLATVPTVAERPATIRTVMAWPCTLAERQLQLKQ